MDCIKFNLSIKNNAGLPHYPNPGLRDTLERYLNWLEPLVTKEELAQAINEVDAFQALEQFPRLERKMDELAEGSDDSYIYNYWVKGHLGFRDPICPYTSVPILYDNPTLRNLSQAEKAAARRGKDGHTKGQGTEVAADRGGKKRKRRILWRLKRERKKWERRF